jgi:hypothetical protein
MNNVATAATIRNSCSSQAGSFAINISILLAALLGTIVLFNQPWIQDAYFDSAEQGEELALHSFATAVASDLRPQVDGFSGTVREQFVPGLNPELNAIKNAIRIPFENEYGSFACFSLYDYGDTCSGPPNLQHSRAERLV